MATLHLMSRSDGETLTQCARLLTAGDTVVWLVPARPWPVVAEVEFLQLFNPADSYATFELPSITMERLVDLVVSHQPVVTW